MKVVLNGTCSECYQVTDLVLTEKSTEIVCPTCGHSVPQLDENSMASLAKDQSKRRLVGAVGAAAFFAAAGLFFGFVANSGGGVLGHVPPIPGNAMGMLVGSIIMLLISLGAGFFASSRSYVCEF